MTGLPALAWAGLAAAVLLLPGRRTDRAPAADRRGRARTGQGRRPALPFVAAAAVGLACVLVAGPRLGLPAAVVGAVACVGGGRWLARRPVRAAPVRSLAVTLDLAAAALRSGRPVADALELATPAADGPVPEALRQVAGLCRLGADPVQAWSAVPADGPLGSLAATAVRSAASGIKLAAAFERLAGEIRAECRSAAGVRVERVGVIALAPLAACFLPSFVCLGVIPVVVGVASNVLRLPA